MDTISALQKFEDEKFGIFLAPNEENPNAHRVYPGPGVPWDEAQRLAESLVESDRAVWVPLHGGQPATAREVLLRIAAVEAFFGL